MSKASAQKIPEDNKSALEAAMSMEPPLTGHASEKKDHANSPEKNTTTVAPKPRALVPIGPSRCRAAGYLHNTWDITAERAITRGDLHNPDTFKHLAFQLRPFDRLIVLREDGAFYAELLVISCDRTWARVREIHFLDLTTGADDARVSEFEEYKFEWRTLGKWSIIKKGNEGMPALKDGFETRVDAVLWLDEHLRNRNVS